MPHCMVQSNVAIPKEKQLAFVNDLSDALSEALKKPKQYVMVGYQTIETMNFNGDEPCALIHIASIGGLDLKVNNTICQQVASLCSRHLGIKEGRTYTHLTDVSPANLGMGSHTFG